MVYYQKLKIKIKKANKGSNLILCKNLRVRNEINSFHLRGKSKAWNMHAKRQRVLGSWSSVHIGLMHATLTLHHAAIASHALKFLWKYLGENFSLVSKNFEIQIRFFSFENLNVFFFPMPLIISEKKSPN